MTTDIPFTDWLAEKVKACQAGDADAQAELYKELWPRVMRIAIRVQSQSWMAGRGHTWAEDAAAHAFSGLFEKIDSITEPAGLMGWFWRVIHNYLITQGRRMAREALTHELWPFDEQGGVRDSTPLLTEIPQLQQELLKLAPEELELIQMKFGDELGMQQIANHFGITVAAANARLRKIYGKLRTGLALAGYFDHEGRVEI